LIHLAEFEVFERRVSVETDREADVGRLIAIRHLLALWCHSPSRTLTCDSAMQDTASTSASGTNAADTIAGMGAGELTLSDGSETSGASAGMGARASPSSDVVSLSFH
jgi:hypothetical protein